MILNLNSGKRGTETPSSMAHDKINYMTNKMFEYHFFASTCDLFTLEINKPSFTSSFMRENINDSGVCLVYQEKCRVPMHKVLTGKQATDQARTKTNYHILNNIKINNNRKDNFTPTNDQAMAQVTKSIRI